MLFVALAILESHRDVILRYLVEVGGSSFFGLNSTDVSMLVRRSVESKLHWKNHFGTGSDYDD